MLVTLVTEHAPCLSFNPFSDCFHFHIHSCQNFIISESIPTTDSSLLLYIGISRLLRLIHMCVGKLWCLFSFCYKCECKMLHILYLFTQRKVNTRYALELSCTQLAIHLHFKNKCHSFTSSYLNESLGILSLSLLVFLDSLCGSSYWAILNILTCFSNR